MNVISKAVHSQGDQPVDFIVVLAGCSVLGDNAGPGHSTNIDLGHGITRLLRAQHPGTAAHSHTTQWQRDCESALASVPALPYVFCCHERVSQEASGVPPTSGA